MINQYLGDYLPKTQKALREEYKCDEYQVCDNIDLDALYLEYCSLFQIKFGKKPKILKRIDGTTHHIRNPVLPSTSSTTTAQRNGAGVVARQSSIGRKKEPETSQLLDMEGVLKISSTSNISINNGSVPSSSSSSSAEDEKMQINENIHHNQPPTVIDFDCFPEDWREIVENICRTIVTTTDKFDTTWSNVHGATLAKNVLRESVILPLERPDLFKTIRPWRSALLHGPPGTGKTLMAKALAAECSGRVTFFNVHSSSITSKWRGESEKYIRVRCVE